MIRILLVDDQNIVRQGLQALLELKAQLTVVGTAKDGNSAIEQVAILRPDVVLIDIEMPGINGIAATHKICQQFPKTKVLVLSSHENIKYVKQALQAGAQGYLLKDTLTEDLERAIWSVYRGYTQFTLRLLQKVLAEACVPPPIISIDQSKSTPDKKQLRHTSLELHSDDNNSFVINEEYTQEIRKSLTGGKNGSSSKISQTILKTTIEQSQTDIRDSSHKVIEASDLNNSVSKNSFVQKDLVQLEQKPQLDKKSSLVVPAKQSQRGMSKLHSILLLALLLIGIGIGVRYYFLGQSKDNNFELSGMIEGYETDLGAKVEGRIESITVREGDRLKKGQIIAQLDNRELQAQLQGAKALIQTAKEEENQARLQIEVIQNQITEAQLNLRQSTEEAKGIINQAQSNLAASKAQLAEAQAQVKQVEAEKKLAQADHARSASLLQDGVISQQQFDQSQTQLDSTQATLQASRAAVNEAQKQVNVAEGEIIQAKTSSLNPEINKAVIGGLTKQLAQAQAQVKGAISKVADFKARQEEIAARLDDLKIISPIDGVVLTRNTEPGEVITRGTTLMTIIDPNDVYLRGYLPEGKIGGVRVGQAAKVFLDSAPNRPLDATVTKIDSQASFTPENIYFRSDRVTQVFGLKLKIKNPNGFAKIGMPADGKIMSEERIKRSGQH